MSDPYQGSRGGSRTSPAPGSMYGSRTSPAHGSLHGSRSSLNQGSISGDPIPIEIDPSLINPADTIPTPEELPPTPPTEATGFTLPGFQEPSTSKDTKAKKGGGVSGKFKGGFGKMKGLFHKKPKDATGTANGIEDFDDEMGSTEYLDKIATPGASGAAGIEKEKQSTMQKIQNLFKKNHDMAPPSVYQPGDIMILKEQPPKTRVTFGNFINVLLLCLMLAGFIMCCCISVEPALYYLGPMCLGLASFALVGKIFFSCFWEEDPVPRRLKPALAFYEKYLGGVKDPYAHKKYTGTGQRPSVAAYLGPMSVTMKSDVVAMDTFSFPPPAQPRMYDESIDTRLRDPIQASQSNNPSYNGSRQQSPLPFTNTFGSHNTSNVSNPPSYATDSPNRSIDKPPAAWN